MKLCGSDFWAIIETLYAFRTYAHSYLLVNSFRREGRVLVLCKNLGKANARPVLLS